MTFRRSPAVLNIKARSCHTKAFTPRTVSASRECVLLITRTDKWLTNIDEQACSHSNVLQNKTIK